jgi:hypothetical protein
MEADYLDRASGIHIRFRLGGAVFPPKIFYKIYTHRPLCDINAFAPRNYSIERRAQPDPLSLHNKPSSLSFSSTVPTHRAALTTGGSRSSFIRKIQSSIRVGRAFYDATITPPVSSVGMDDWYQREDDRSNPWRVISTELEEVLDPPPPWVLLDRRQEELTAEHKRKKNDLTSSPTSAYHYSRLRRQQDLVLEKKRRKREWMLKAYTLTAGTKGMAGGNDQPSMPLPREEEIGERGEAEKMERRRSSNLLPLHQHLHHQIEMCDSFSSRGEPAAPFDNLLQSSRQAIDGTREEGVSSEGLQQLRDSSASKLHLNRVSFPMVDPPPLHEARVEEAVGGTDDALLKWRFGDLLSSTHFLPSLLVL